MGVLLIDFEATGKDAQTVRPLEIGAIVTSNDFKEVLAGYSQIIYDKDYPVLDPVVQKITGITQEILDTEGIPPKQAFLQMLDDLYHDESLNVQYIVAYNRLYDETLFKAECARLFIMTSMATHTPWLCAMSDVEKNYEFKSWKLMHVALDHGVTVNPKELHRAINDVELMRQMLVAAEETAENMYAYQLVPSVYVKAVVPAPWKDGGKGRDACKAQGFGWQQSKGDDKVFDGCWIKKIKEKDFEKLEALCEFPIRIIS